MLYVCNDKHTLICLAETKTQDTQLFIQFKDSRIWIYISKDKFGEAQE